MSRTNFRSDYRRADGPRKVRNGIKLRGAEAPDVEHPMVRRWFEAVESRFDAEYKAEALSYAQSGQTIALDLLLGGIRGDVQGWSPKPRRVNIDLPKFDAAQWDQAVATLAGQARHAAKLHAGELTSELDEALRRKGLSLIPQHDENISVNCTCPAKGLCKHALTLIYLAVERMNEEPFLLFQLRGLPADTLLERMRQQRTIRATGIAKAHHDPPLTVTDPPLEDCIDDFWRCRLDVSAEDVTSSGEHVSHALLRRLGPSPLAGKFPLVGLLASVYDTMQQAGQRIRDEAEDREE